LAIVTLPILLLVFDNAYSYLESILELDSATRGWNSGGTGRFGRWQLGLATVFSNPLTLLSGYGLRSTDGLSLGFSIESSYINILIECGVLLGPAFVFAILRLVFAYFPHGSRASAERGPLDVAPVLLLYCMLQSIFNRYLLGIGNPLSLVVLLLAISLSVQGVRSAAASRATNAPSPDPTARPGRTAKLVAAD
jgi:hypothetical protein